MDLCWLKSNITPGAETTGAQTQVIEAGVTAQCEWDMVMSQIHLVGRDDTGPRFFIEDKTCIETALGVSCAYGKAIHETTTRRTRLWSS